MSEMTQEIGVGMDHYAGLLTALATGASIPSVDSFTDGDIGDLADHLLTVTTHVFRVGRITCQWATNDIRWLVSELHGAAGPYELAAHVWRTTGGWAVPDGTSPEQWCAMGVALASYAMCQAYVSMESPSLTCENADMHLSTLCPPAITAACTAARNHLDELAAATRNAASAANTTGGRSDHLVTVLGNRARLDELVAAKTADLVHATTSGQALEAGVAQAWNQFAAACQLLLSTSELRYRAPEHDVPPLVQRGIVVPADVAWADAATCGEYQRGGPGSYGTIADTRICYVTKTLYDQYLSCLNLTAMEPASVVSDPEAATGWVFLQATKIPYWIYDDTYEPQHTLWHTWGDLVVSSGRLEPEDDCAGTPLMSPRFARMLALAGVFPQQPGHIFPEPEPEEQ